MPKKVIIALLMVMMLCLTGCPAESDGVTAGDADYGSDANYDMKSTEEVVEGMAGENLFATDGENRKLVYTGDITIGTDSIKKTYKKVAENMKTYGAFFESVSGSSTYKTMTIRVPKKDFMNFFESLSDVGGTVTSSSVNIQDKSKSYADNEKRLEILQTEYDELKELMTEAKTVEEVLSIRDRMSNVTYEIEMLKGTNNTIDYDADYGTLQLTLQLNGTHDEESFWHQLSEAFSGGVYLFKSLIVGIVYIWWIVLIAGYGVYAFVKKKWPFNRTKKKIDELFPEDKDV